MKALPVLFVTLLTVALAGCSGGSSSSGATAGDDDDDDDDDDGGAAYTIADGNYAGANTVSNANTCGVNLTMDDAPFSISVDGDKIDLGNGIQLTRVDNDLTGGGSGSAQLGTDCTVEATLQITGEVTGNDLIHLREQDQFSMPTGTCAGFTFPCTLDLDYDVQKS